MVTKLSQTPKGGCCMIPLIQLLNSCFGQRILPIPRPSPFPSAPPQHGGLCAGVAVAAEGRGVCRHRWPQPGRSLPAAAAQEPPGLSILLLVQQQVTSRWVTLAWAPGCSLAGSALLPLCAPPTMSSMQPLVSTNQQSLCCWVLIPFAGVFHRLSTTAKHVGASAAQLSLGGAVSV